VTGTIPDALRRELLDPPPAALDIPGTGGQLRRRPEDFRVRELPAYAPDGREGAHLLLTLWKRGWNTEDAVREVARQLGLSQASIGRAGLKDRAAVTEQWVSLPWEAAGAVERFAHPDIRLGPPHPHGNKLRRGHLKGNRFEIVLRNLERPPAEALELAGSSLALVERQGLDNLYGEQRFGREGANLERGLALLARPRFLRRADLMFSAVQAALFNIYLLLRRRRGLLDRVLMGDVLRRLDSGGPFTCEDPREDQPRLEAGELCITGPVFGSRQMSPPARTAAAELEAEVLANCGVEPASLKALGKKAQGSRRALRVFPGPIEVEPVADEEGLGGGLRLRFELPAGSYATQLLREVMLPVEKERGAG